MRINYFYICSSGAIVETYIDTSENIYISHTEDSVTFIDSYPLQVTRTRVFDIIRQERVETYKNRIKDLQESLVALENATSYNHYTELIYKNK